MTDRYALVGCSLCDGTWIVDSTDETTACPSCGERYNVSARKFFATAQADDDLSRLRDERGRLNAKHWDDSDLGAWFRVRANGLLAEQVEEWAERVNSKVEAFYQHADKSQGDGIGGDGRATTPHGDESERLDRLLHEARKRGDRPLLWYARVLFGTDVESSDKDWTWVKDNCERHSLVKEVNQATAQRDKWATGTEAENPENKAGLVWVFTEDTPSPGVLNTTSKQSPSAVGMEEQSSGASSSEALANARGKLKRREALDTAEDWGLLLRDCAAKRLGHERSPEGVRTDSKYNTLRVALDSHDRVLNGFAEAAEAGATRAAVITVTTGEGWCGSIYEASIGLRDDVNLLKGKLKRDLGRSGRPPTLWVPDGSARGLPHAHLVAFDVDADTLSEHDLHNYWCEARGRGHQVNVLPITTTNTGAGADADAWEWAGSSPVDAVGRSPATYLAKGPDAVASTAALNTTELRAVADAHVELGAAPVEPGLGPDLPVDVDGVEDVGAHPGAVRLTAFFWANPLSRVAPKPSWADEDDRVAALRRAFQADG